MKLKYYSHVFVSIIVLVIVASAYGAWYTHVGKKSAQAVSLGSEIQAKYVSTIRTKQSKTELEHALADEVSIKEYFVDTREVVSFLESLQSSGAIYGTKVDVVSVSAEPAKPHAVLVLALRITGPFDGVERMLGAIEYEAHDTVITSVTLDTTGAQPKAAPVWTASANVRIGTLDATATTTKP